VPITCGVGAGHIKGTVVITQGGGPNAPGCVAAIQGELAGTGKTIPDLAPVGQITAVKDRHTRKILE